MDVVSPKLKIRFSPGDLLWVGITNVEGLGDSIPIELSTHYEAPRQEQLAAVEAGIMRFPSLRASITQQVFDYYKAMRSEAEDEKGRSGEPFPLIESPEQVWSLLSEPKVYSYDEVLRGIEVSFLFSCEWDIDYGVEVKISPEGQITYVGQLSL